MVIRPTKLIKGQGLAMLMVEANLQVVGIDATGECTMNNTQGDEATHVAFLFKH
jgi:hypothetical protein